MPNPFTPNLFGFDPPVFVGRDREIQECFQTLRSGEIALRPATAIVGHRGSGKTVLLNAIGKEAERTGWAVISANIWPGILRELNSEPIDTVLRLYGRGGWDWAKMPESSLEGLSEFNGVFENLLAVAKSQGKGLLISLDDVRPYLLDEFAQIVKSVQSGWARGDQIALVYTGLPDLMGNPENTMKVNFLNDAWGIFIEELSMVDTERALGEPFKMAGISIDEEALQYAVKASAGYPFLIQLIGYQICRSLARRSTRAHIEIVREAIGHIMVAFNNSVLESSLVGLNRESLNLLAVIAMFDGPVYFSTINKQPGYLGHQLPSNCIELARRELLHLGEAKDAVFGIPHLREYLRSSTFLKPLG